MIPQLYRATLKYDNGKIHLTVHSLNGEQGAKNRIMAAEKCPEKAIISPKHVKIKNPNPIKTAQNETFK
ncbi:hypothetical protein [Pedobacter agri]|uniref:hypothetical protein n=1 Tax=Pedobacter agri TaxID=454586 RepID=UPI002930EBF9|nr:hypothetical protein [Pedobacter agri]